MAAVFTRRPKTFGQFLVFLVTFLPFVAFGQTIVDSFRGDIRSCEKVCESEFADHDSSEDELFKCCRHGCRLLNLIDILDDFSDLNDTKNACFKSCRNSYLDDGIVSANVDASVNAKVSGNVNAIVSACLFGCESQIDGARNRKQQMQDYHYSQNLENLSPTLYINRIFSNMIEKARDRTSRSYYSQTINGGLVVVASKPSLMSDAKDDLNKDDFNYMEMQGDTLLGSVSELSSVRKKEDVLPLLDKDGVAMAGNQVDGDLLWRTCIIVKTGTTRFLVACLVLLLVLLIVWIWSSSATVAQNGCKILVREQSLKHLPFAATAADKYHILFLSSDEVKTRYPLFTTYSKSTPMTNPAPTLPVKLRMELV